MLYHAMSSSDSLPSACKAWSNPPSGEQLYSISLLPCPAGLMIPLGTPAVQNLNGTTRDYFNDYVKILKIV